MPSGLDPTRFMAWCTGGVSSRVSPLVDVRGDRVAGHRISRADRVSHRRRYVRRGGAAAVMLFRTVCRFFSVHAWNADRIGLALAGVPCFGSGAARGTDSPVRRAGELISVLAQAFPDRTSNVATDNIDRFVSQPQVPQTARSRGSELSTDQRRTPSTSLRPPTRHLHDLESRPGPPQGRGDRGARSVRQLSLEFDVVGPNTGSTTSTGWPPD